MLACGLETADTVLVCDAPVVRDLCVAVEAAIGFQLLPPLLHFSFSGPGAWHVLSQMPQVVKRDKDDDGVVGAHLAAEAVALARGLGQKQLSLVAPQASSALRDAYAARLWLALAVRAEGLAAARPCSALALRGLRAWLQHGPDRLWPRVG